MNFNQILDLQSLLLISNRYFDEHENTFTEQLYQQNNGRKNIDKRLVILESCKKNSNAWQHMIQKLEIENQSLKERLNQKQIGVTDYSESQKHKTKEQNQRQTYSQNHTENTLSKNNFISLKSKFLVSRNRSLNQHPSLSFEQQKFSQIVDQQNDEQADGCFQDQSDQSEQQTFPQTQLTQQTKQIQSKQQKSMLSGHRNICMKALTDQLAQQPHINENYGLAEKYSQEMLGQKEKPAQKLKTMQQICLYGPSFSDMQQNKIQKSHVNSQLFYPFDRENYANSLQEYKSEKSRFQKYRHSLFPQKVQIKRVKQQKQATQTGRIIHKKNAKRNDICSYIFQAQEGHAIHRERKINSTVEIANPNSNLYAFTVHFTDYVCLKVNQSIECDKKPRKSSEALQNENPQSSKQLKKLRSTETLILDGSQNSKKFGQQPQSSVTARSQQIYQDGWDLYLGRFCLCIFSYFPFVNLFQKILSKLVEQIKIKRMEAYANQPQDLKAIDVKYLIKQLQNLSQKLINQINRIPVSLDSSGICEIQGKQMEINFSLPSIINEMYKNWPYQILKIFDRQTLYQTIYCIMFDQSVCFLCQDTHILTYCVLLFTDLLMRPFFSPHPSCSIMIQEQFLSAPFIVNMGVPKSTEWFQANKNLFDQKKVVIDLNGGQAKFRTKRNGKSLKSQKIKKAISNFYKKMRGNQSQILLFASKQKRSSSTYSSLSTKNQDESFFIFLESMQSIFQEQLLAHLPACSQISQLKKTLSDKYDSEIVIRREAFKYLQIQIRKSRKKDYKDELINAMIDQQIFYEYAVRKYGLQ